MRYNKEESGVIIMDMNVALRKRCTYGILANLGVHELFWWYPGESGENHGDYTSRVLGELYMWISGRDNIKIFNMLWENYPRETVLLWEKLRRESK